MLRVEVDTREVEAALAELERRGQNPAPAMRVIRKEMRLDQRDHAREKEGPEGKWPARAASTIAKIRKGSGRARRPMGRLVSAVAYTAERSRVVGRSLVRWSGSHMEGDRVGRGATLPARPFLWISDKLLDTAETVLARFLLNGWGRP